MDNESVFKASPETRRKVTDLFTGEEIKTFTRRSDWRGFWAIFSTWAIIGLALAGMTWAVSVPWPLAVPLWIAGLLVVAGRQLALSILMHEGAHRTLFKSVALNDTFTDWTCARPLWGDLHKYRVHHRQHHLHTGTDGDIDLTLITGYPTTRRSMLRKVLRDLTGVTGAKYLLGRLLMDAGVLKWTVANDIQRLPAEGRRLPDYVGRALTTMAPMLLCNGLLLALCAMAGHAWLYAVWVLAYVTPFPLLVRIRSLAEHACMARSTDMFLNTRTTRAGWLARTLVAPVRVNYHMEHHAMASVPYYRLPALHRLLRARRQVPRAPGYWRVLKQVSSRQAAA